MDTFLRFILIGWGLFFFVPAIPFIVLERFYPARRIAYGRIMLRDLAHCLAVATVAGVPASMLSHWVERHLGLASWGAAHAPHLPAAVKVILLVLAIDCGQYWVHRFMHSTAIGWRMHRFHHSTTDMWWLPGGLRSSVLNMFVQSVPVFFFADLLDAPSWFGILWVVKFNFLGHWMHANIMFRNRWLESVLITPTTHQIHHDMSPRIGMNANYGFFITIWDRLFGTYHSPESLNMQGSLKTGDTSPVPLEYGIPEKVNIVRLLTGV